jgi:hypothetical protein
MIETEVPSHPAASPGDRDIRRPIAPDLAPATALAPVDPAAPVSLRRHKAPKDSKVYKVAIAYIALKAQGLQLTAISEQLGVPKTTIQTYVKRAHRFGWLRPKDLDVEDQFEISIPEKVARNVNEFLDERDKDITVEAAKGIGLFKNHQAVKVDGQVGVGFALKVQVELPAGIESRSPITIRPGSVGGTPAIDAEILGEGE